MPVTAAQRGKKAVNACPTESTKVSIKAVSKFHILDNYYFLLPKADLMNDST